MAFGKTHGKLVEWRTFNARQKGLHYSDLPRLKTSALLPLFSNWIRTCKDRLYASSDLGYSIARDHSMVLAPSGGCPLTIQGRILWSRRESLRYLHVVEPAREIH